jgi:hypothetical protein
MINSVRQILQVFERHGLWEAGVELVGSWCFYLYQQHLDVKSYPLKTQDIDFLIPDPYRGKKHVDLVQEFERLGFQKDHRYDGAVYLWNAELRIEFLVPEKGRGTNKAKLIKSLGIRAIPLRFVNMLLEHPITLREGRINVTVPNPAAFCLHKLLIGNRRGAAEKRLKDFEQALAVIPAVKLSQLRTLYRELPKTWQRGVLRALERAAQDLPQMEEEANRLKDTLQTGN